MNANNLSDATNPLMGTVEARESEMLEVCSQFDLALDMNYFIEAAAIREAEMVVEEGDVASFSPWDYYSGTFLRTFTNYKTFKATNEFKWLESYMPVRINDYANSEHSNDSIFNQDSDVGNIVSPVFNCQGVDVNYRIDSTVMPWLSETGTLYSIVPGTTAKGEREWVGIQALLPGTDQVTKQKFNYWRLVTLLRLIPGVAADDWFNEFIKVNHQIEDGYEGWSKAREERLENKRQAREGQASIAREALENM